MLVGRRKQSTQMIRMTILLALISAHSLRTIWMTMAALIQSITRDIFQIRSITVLEVYQRPSNIRKFLQLKKNQQKFAVKFAEKLVKVLTPII